MIQKKFILMAAFTIMFLQQTSELTETMFTKGDDISKEDFETSFISAMEGLGISSGKINIPSEFYPDLNENYKFLLLNGVGGGG